jgi:L-lactate dehydrogenase complex protein LldF
MCLTLPEVLITVMGIEKVVSECRDLEIFLQLLPRSATGEPMNPYTSLWTGITSGDGPREFHLVLLDNGRSSVLGDPVDRQTLRCIRCSACLNSCPVYSRTGGHAYESPYQGPIGAIISPQLFGLDRSGSLPYASSLCGACYDVCPVEIDIPRVLVHLRSRIVEEGRAPRGERLAMHALMRAFASRRGYEALQRTGLFGGQLLARGGRIGRLPGPLSAWTAVRDFPAPPNQTFRQWWREQRGSDPRRTPYPASPGSAGPGAPDGIHGKALVRGLDARAAILGRVQEALGNAGPSLPVERRYRRHSGGPQTELVRQFSARLAELGAEVRRARGGELATVLAELCQTQGANHLVVPDDLPEAWTPEGVEVSPDLRLSYSRLDLLDGALTGCALAIAATGTIVLDGGAAQGRRVLTLVPDYHLCVICEHQIVGIVPEAIRALGPAVRNRRPVTFISGPSATSDIELRRVEGVHGPRTLHVVITDAT